jgi:parvulin-like peptidyl-prolyl isomerase
MPIGTTAHGASGRLTVLALVLGIAGVAAAQAGPPPPAPRAGQPQGVAKAPGPKPKVVAAGATVERIVAVVNDDIILQSELEEKYKPARDELWRQMERASATQRQAQAQILKRRVLDALIDERLLVQQAQQLKLGVTSEEIDRAVEEIRKQNGVDLDELMKALKSQGMSMAQYRQDLRRQILRLKVINAAVRSRISVSDDEVKAYYEQNVRKLGVQRSVRASHIFLIIPEHATAQEVERKRRLCAELVRRARAGEDFGKLAKQYSDDAATKDEGGDLGYFTRGSLPPAVEEVVFNMEIGEVRGPIRATRGFHVFKVLDRKDEGIKPLAQIKEGLRQQLYQQEMEKATKAWLTEIRKKAHLETRPE